MNVLQSIQELTYSLTFYCRSWKKKCYRKRLSIWLIPGRLPLWASDMAFVWSFIGKTIQSLFINMSFAVILISSRIGLNLFNSFGEFFGIQFCPFHIISISSVNTGCSFVALTIDAIPML